MREIDIYICISYDSKDIFYGQTVLDITLDKALFTLQI